MGSIRGLADALINMTVTGVSSNLSSPPATLPNTPDLPAKWTMLASADLNDFLWSCVDQNETISMDVYVAVEPFGQGTMLSNYDATITAADNLRTALKALTKDDTGFNFQNYTLRMTTAEEAENINYWAVVATVTCRNS